MRQINVAILYHYVAHYRSPIFSELERSDNEIQYLIYAGDEVNDEFLAVQNVEDTGVRKENAIKNIWFGKHFLWQKGALRLAYDRKVDVLIILGNMFFLSSWLLVIAARLNKKKVLMWTHGVRRSDNMINIIRVGFYKLANGLLLYGHRAEDMLGRLGVRKNRMYVIYNSLNFELMQSLRHSVHCQELRLLRKEISSDSQAPIIITSGRLTKEKRIDLLIHSLSKLNNSNAVLLIVGDGPERAALQDIAFELGISCRVKFWGACYDENINSKLFMMSNLCVVPGNIGLTCIHSMSYGVPCITHDDFNTQKPECEAILSGETGDFFKAGNVSDLTRKINDWIDLSLADKTIISQRCLDLVEKRYNPSVQKRLIDAAVRQVYA